MRLLNKLQILKEVRNRARLYNYPVFSSYWQFFKYAKFGKYSPGEIFMMDLLNPTISEEENKTMISVESMLEYELSVNPKSHRELTEDKVKFHNFCVDNNLPVPVMVAYIDTKNGSKWYKGDKITTVHDLIDGLSKFPYDLLLKPTQGDHGKKVTNLNYIDGKHVLDKNIEDTLSEFLNAVFSEKDGQYVIQQKLYCHSEIAKFTGNPMLQTMRVETHIDKDGQAKLLGQKIKFPSRGKVVDNFLYGTGNNRIGHVTPDGLVNKTLLFCDDKKHLIVRDLVEDTEGNKTTFQIPLWEDVVELVLKAQVIFQPLQTIGWDVGITDDGPVLIEGNSYWDPHYRQCGKMGDILEKLDMPTEQVFGVNRFKNH